MRLPVSAWPVSGLLRMLGGVLVGGAVADSGECLGRGCVVEVLLVAAALPFVVGLAGPGGVAAAPAVGGQVAEAGDGQVVGLCVVRECGCPDAQHLGAIGRRCGSRFPFLRRCRLTGVSRLSRR